MVHFHIANGEAETVLEQLDKGMIDFGLLLGKVDLSKYNYFKLPAKDIWGILMLLLQKSK